jgi:ADP-heptose:LPS heptosyltransferase
MNIRLMRFVDRYAGVPLCWISGLWHRRFSRRRIPFQSPPRAILIIKFFGMGSILLSAPSLAALREAFPDARIYYLSFSSNREILERLPFPFTPLTISSESALSFVRDTITVIRTVRRASVTVVFDLEFFSKFSTLISSLSGASERVGFELPTFWRRANLTVPVPFDRSLHVIEMFSKQLQAFGIRAVTPSVQISIQANTEERVSLERKLALGRNGVEVIAVNINAGATSLERRWPAERFAEVVRRLLAQNPHRRFLFLGTKAEREYVGRMLHENPDIQFASVNCAGALSLGEAIALLERSSFLLTNDSGPMHLASAAGTPVVALFGPESPRFYGPLGEHRIVYKSLSCSPCLNIYNAKLFVCPYDALCMKEITVEDVLAAIHSLEKLPVREHA